jgi:two-component system chemotaxis response regulator CheY
MRTYKTPDRKSSVISSKKILGLTVVLGDTNSYSRQIVRSALGGYGVRKISDCRDGIEVLKTARYLIPSVVLIDHELAGLTAPEVTRMLRRDPSTQMLPVVVMSAAPTRALVTASVLAGAHEFVAKPFSSQTLFERLSRAAFVHRDFLRTRTYFGPAPYDPVMRERLEKEAAELSGIAALPTIEDVLKIKRSDGDFISI